MIFFCLRDTWLSSKPSKEKNVGGSDVQEIENGLVAGAIGKRLQSVHIPQSPTLEVCPHDSVSVRSASAIFLPCLWFTHLVQREVCGVS